MIRQAIKKNKVLMLRKFREFTSKSKMTEDDALKL